MIRPVSFDMSFQAVADSISLRARKIAELWWKMESVCFLPRQEYEMIVEDVLIKQHWKKSNNDKLIHRSKKSSINLKRLPLISSGI